FGASRDCKSSMLEQKEVKRRYLTTSMRLGNCLRKRSLGVSQDLETKMCDEEGKRQKTLSAREGRVITCVL
ncbi:MAG: hypothetical protein PWP09_1860, partial [Thermotogota bacterium]|nr:hypothetical protein [Thermotogota bacterium]